MPRTKTGKPIGRPPKKNKQVVARILKVARTGLPLKFAAQAGNIDPETMAQWCAKDPEFNRALSEARLEAVEKRWQQIQKAAEDRLDKDGNLVKAGDWKSIAWQLERTFPADFARPEVALSLIQQNNTVENSLVINITGPEAKAIEAQADPIRAEVAAMFAQYRPLSGGSESTAHDVETTSISEPQISQTAESGHSRMITHQAGDENSPGFWRMLVSADSESQVKRETAEFVIRTLLAQLQGYKAHRMEIDLGDEAVTVEDVFSRLEQLCGGASGWQTAQKLAGYTAST